MATLGWIFVGALVGVAYIILFAQLKEGWDEWRGKDK